MYANFHKAFFAQNIEEIKRGKHLCVPERNAFRNGTKGERERFFENRSGTKRERERFFENRSGTKRERERFLENRSGTKRERER